tara:strand:- start:422 stop:583 length:162 start_codon:yes stop_codon:yes gene_type:complete
MSPDVVTSSRGDKREREKSRAMFEGTTRYRYGARRQQMRKEGRESQIRVVIYN